MIHWGKFSSPSLSPPSRPPTSPPNSLTSLCTLLPAPNDWSPDEVCVLNICNFTCPECLQRTSISFTLIDNLILMLAPFLSLGTWAWTTSVRSSPEPSTDCTCYRNCEYKKIIHLINLHRHNSQMTRNSHSPSRWYAQTSVMGIDDSGLPLISLTKKGPAAIG